ncbi:ATP-binding protein [Frisingicoccus sp.]|uniref:ATP-binding protein n=1 Tax=Frisingicoccus sp. TaxID=1918627 RepID=UPI002E7802AE|nr:ATP-binding protein [Frisingicoccus sp.]MEE0751715.1 ATP-binding protein [Frisingicoccus sp.]
MKVSIYKDRVEIYNPGAFPDGFEPQDFIDKSERPIRRNPKIARILYYSKDIESFGTGLKRIVDACNAAGVKYEFQKKKSGFVVCFYRTGNEAGKKPIKADKKPIKADKNAGQNERYEMIIKYIQERGFITNKEAREILGLADSTVKRILKGMVDKEILTIEGERKARRYLLK